MSGRDDFGWRPPRRHDIRDTFGKRRPSEGRQFPAGPRIIGKASRPPLPQAPRRTTSSPPTSKSAPQAASWAIPRESPAIVDPLSPDDIVRNERHGIGVVIAVSEFDCDVRFYDGRIRLDPARLTTILRASGAQAFLAEALSTGKAKASPLRGAALWLRSAEGSITSVALRIFSRSRDPKIVAMVEEALSGCGPRKRQRIVDQLSEAREHLGLPTWPETVSAVKAAEADRTARAAAAAGATATRVQPQAVRPDPRPPSPDGATRRTYARPLSRGDEAVLSQLKIIDAIRVRLGESPLTPQQRATVRNAVLAKLDSPDEYRKKCWHCGAPVHSRFNPRCPTCSWFSCVCGACRQPDFVDGHGARQPICPREARLLA